MAFEGSQVIFAILKWIGVALCLAGFGMAVVTALRSGYPPPAPGAATAWAMLGGSGLSLWIVAVIGEMVGYAADRARRAVDLLEQMNARQE